MQHVEIQTAQNVGIALEVAGLGDRVLAALIDYAVLAAYFVLGGFLLAYLFDVMGGPSPFVIVLVLLPPFLYFLLCEVFLNGQSIGKKVRKIKVARLDGTQPTLGNYLLRWLMRPVEIGLFAGVPALASVVLGDKGQRLGDRAAGTTVISLKPRTTLQDTLFARVNTDYTPVFAQIETLSPEEITTAKEVLTALVTETRSVRMRELGEMMKAALEAKIGTRSDLDPIPFLRTVIHDYNQTMGRL